MAASRCSRGTFQSPPRWAWRTSSAAIGPSKLLLSIALVMASASTPPAGEPATRRPRARALLERDVVGALRSGARGHEAGGGPRHVRVGRRVGVFRLPQEVDAVSDQLVRLALAGAIAGVPL